MKNYLFVACGSMLGGVARYFLSNFVYKFLNPIFPYGTLLVNITGSFLIGLILFYLDAQKLISSETRIFLTIGFCGGLTTFSTFTYETFQLLRNSEYLLAFINVGTNLIFTFIAILIAYIISQKLIY